jgi:hypothetical protein
MYELEKRTVLFWVIVKLITQKSAVLIYFAVEA